MIKHPMDLGTMRAKVDNMDYPSFDAFKADFNQIIANCTLFNETGSAYYRYAEKLKEGCRTIINRFLIWVVSINFVSCIDGYGVVLASSSSM